MAAEGAIAMKKTILTLFYFLNFTIFFSLKMVSEFCHLRGKLKKNKQKQCLFISLGLTHISKLNYIIMCDVRLK